MAIASFTLLACNDVIAVGGSTLAAEAKEPGVKVMRGEVSDKNTICAFVVVDRDEMRLNKQPITMEELPIELEQLVKANANCQAILQATPDSPASLVMDVVEVMGEHFESFAIATKTEPTVTIEHNEAKQ